MTVNIKPGKNSLPPNPNNNEIVSYQKLRAFIGMIGIFLPIGVVLGCLLFGAGCYAWQVSISHYYYSIMHILFVCILCVLGGFLITYRGKNKWESRLSNLAGCCAFGIAAFPTKFDGFRSNGNNQYVDLLKKVTEFWGGVHYEFAATLFVCFIIFCLHFFQIPDEDYTGVDAEKFERRKRVYKFCGWTIIISIIAIGLFNFVFHVKEGVFIYSTFIFETTSLWAFGTAWLVKGSKILQRVPLVKKVIEPLR